MGAVVVLLLGGLGGPVTPVAPVARVTRVVAFGDSVPDGARCACTPFPALVAARLGVGVEQLAEDGATSADTARTVGAHLPALTRGDVVLLETGANDLAPLVDGAGDDAGDDAGVRAAAGAAVARVAATVEALRATGARVVVLDYWAVGLDGDVAALRYTPRQRRLQGELTDAYDDRLACALAGRAVVVGLRPTFHAGAGATPLLAADGDHPDAAGHRAIAAAVLTALGWEDATGSPGIG
nr:SGNH/GDSL hydrolase family protein [Kineococcus aurantiacus]